VGPACVRASSPQLYDLQNRCGRQARAK
jgi:hypothetical protein